MSDAIRSYVLMCKFIHETATRFAEERRQRVAVESSVFRSVALDNDYLEWVSSIKIRYDFNAHQRGVECIGECIGGMKTATSSVAVIL